MAVGSGPLAEVLPSQNGSELLLNRLEMVITDENEWGWEMEGILQGMVIFTFAASLRLCSALVEMTF